VYRSVDPAKKTASLVFIDQKLQKFFIEKKSAFLQFSSRSLTLSPTLSHIVENNNFLLFFSELIFDIFGGFYQHLKSEVLPDDYPPPRITPKCNTLCMYPPVWNPVQKQINCPSWNNIFGIDFLFSKLFNQIMP